MAKNKAYFKIKAQANQAADIYLYGYVGDWDADAIFFKDELAKLTDITLINLHIQSEGGTVFEGIAIYNLLKNHSAKIIVHIDGLAASMASYIAMVGDEIIMPENAIMMIHNPSMLAYGETKDLQKSIEMLEVAKNALINAYASRTNKTEQEISEIMDAETWLSAEDAIEQGFADKLAENIDMTACLKLNLTKFKNPPKALTLTPTAVGNTTKEAIMPSNNPTADKTSVDKEAVNTALAQAKADFYKSEKTRRADIAALFSNHDYPELQAEALANIDMTVEMAQSRLLEKIGKENSVKVESFTMGESEASKKEQGLIEAISIRAGITADNPSNPFRSLNMLDIAKQSLQASGKSHTRLSKMEIVAQAFTHTSGDFSGLLANVAEKAMLKGYSEVEESFQKFTQKGSLSDFKINSRTGLGSFPSLDEVREGAEFKYASMGEHNEAIQLATYGKKFGITRQAIINDDLGAFTKIPAKMGAAAKRTVGDLVYKVLMDNPPMADGKAIFHNDHSNLITGAMNSTSLSLLRQKMRKQKDGDAHLNISPQFLIVPVELEATAMQIMAAEFEVSGSKNLTVPNQVRGMAEVVVDGRLDPNAFYLSAGSMFDGIEVAYLDGNDQPVIEQQGGWDIDGVEFKVRLDAGVKALDYRTLAKSTGL